jgi:hypothetical protein
MKLVSLVDGPFSSLVANIIDGGYTFLAELQR